MRLRQFGLLSVLVTVIMFGMGESSHFAASSLRQRKLPPACPTLSVTCPDQVNVGGPLMITVNVSGGDPNVTPTYNWSVSNGTIASGQGTSTIELDTAGLAGGDNVTATVETGGFNRECFVTASCTTSLAKKPETRKLDEYYMLKPADEGARLDNFLIEIQNDPTAQGYIIAYPGPTGRGGDKGNKAKAHLVTKRGIDASRVITIVGGSREQATVELWIVPSGAEPPQATPPADAVKPKPAAPVKPKATAPAKPRRKPKKP